MFVIISTHNAVMPEHQPYDHVGAVFGPFETREAAKAAITELFNFPSPEYVVVREIHTPSTPNH